jgi:hypothetical protein
VGRLRAINACVVMTGACLAAGGWVGPPSGLGRPGRDGTGGYVDHEPGCHGVEGNRRILT